MKYILAINPEDEVEIVKINYVEKEKPLLIKKEPIILKQFIHTPEISDDLSDLEKRLNIISYLDHYWGIKKDYYKKENE
jgi:hypothetical protein